jgi:hypothetical protein
MAMAGSLRSLALLVAALGAASPALAVSIDWVFVGNPSNACDPQSQGCFGSVASPYRIGKYEVTNAQYAEFLSAKAASDPLDLYNTSMGTGSGGIMRSGSPGSYTYSPSAGREDWPVNYVSFYDGLRFANWLHNGQGGGDTETGAYTLLGGTPTPSNGTTVTRNVGAAVFIANEDEWYKAAYYDPGSASYFDYPAGTDTQTVCALPTAIPNRANCNNAVLQLTTAGSYTGSASPHGTFDQGGNVWEWNEAIITGARGLRGGSYFFVIPVDLAASSRLGHVPTDHNNAVGFRVASIPEPSTGLLVLTGLAGLAALRKKRSTPNERPTSTDP